MCWKCQDFVSQRGSFLCANLQPWEMSLLIKATDSLPSDLEALLHSGSELCSNINIVFGELGSPKPEQ